MNTKIKIDFNKIKQERLIIVEKFSAPTYSEVNKFCHCGVAFTEPLADSLEYNSFSSFIFSIKSNNNKLAIKVPLDINQYIDIFDNLSARLNTSSSVLSHIFYRAIQLYNNHNFNDVILNTSNCTGGTQAGRQ